MNVKPVLMGVLIIVTICLDHFTVTATLDMHSIQLITRPAMVYYMNLVHVYTIILFMTLQILMSVPHTMGPVITSVLILMVATFVLVVPDINLKVMGITALVLLTVSVTDVIQSFILKISMNVMRTTVDVVILV